MASLRGQLEQRVLDAVTWSVLKGVRLFQRVKVTPSGLIASETIPKYDLVGACPASSTISLLSVGSDGKQQLKVSPTNYQEHLACWPGMTWGTFVYLSWLSRCWIDGTNPGLKAYLDLLPSSSDRFVDEVAPFMREQEFLDLVDPAAASCGVDRSEFCGAFLHVYSKFRAHGSPMLSGDGTGHPHFVQSAFGRNPGEILALTPILDLAHHSAKPNGEIGFLDEEMIEFYAREKGLQLRETYIAIQAMEDISAGDPITVDRNMSFGFEPKEFEAWFGYPYQ